MIFDQTTLFSDAQAITTSAASTNIIDLSPIAAGVVRDIGKGYPIPIRIQAVEAFAAAGAATLTVTLEVDSVDTFASPKVVWSSAPLAVADLKAGFVVVPEYIARGADERYMRLNYAVGTGPMTAGKITAGVTMGNQSNG